MKSVDNGNTTTFTYNALGQVAEQVDQPYAPVYLPYDPAGQQLGAFVNGAWDLEYVPAGGRRLATYYNGDTWFYHGNRLGSLGVITLH